MTGVAADKWVFSLLVDRTGRILELRGRFEPTLGAPAHALANQPLVSRLDARERLGFLRYLVRLGHDEVAPVSVTLRTPAQGNKRFRMTARVGEPGQAWWLMFADEGETTATASDLSEIGPPFAGADEFSAITTAHDHAKTPLDLTLFRAGALSPDHAMPLPQGERVALDDKLGESLLHHSYERLVTRPEIGEYALLHERQKSASEIGKHLVSVAIRHNVPEHQLGLSHATQNVSADTDAAAVIRDTRRQLQARAAETPSGLTASPAFRVSAWIGGGSVAFLLLVWLFVRISH